MLIPKSGGSSAHPDAHSPDYRLLNFTMRVECGGTGLGGNNIQVVAGTPDRERYGLDRDVDLWLSSGWWLTFRNYFELAPDVASKICGSVADELSAITAEAQDARGPEAEEVARKLFSMSFEGIGPDYWGKATATS
jgi:hypothetical protein